MFQYNKLIPQKLPGGMHLISTLNSPWLSRFSAHPPSILHAWPLARLRTRMSLCSSTKLRQSEKASFIARAKTQSLTARSFQSLVNLGKPSARATTNRGITKWLVLPYFPVMLKTGFTVQAARFWSSKFALHQLSIFPGVTVRISWCNAIKNVAQFSKSYWW